MAAFSSLPLFTDAWLADTGHLDHLDRGIYMDLLILMWRSPNCQVPDDIAWIARKLRVENDQKLNILKSLINEFCERNAGYVLQKRLQREYQYVCNKSAKNSRSAKLRWEKEKDVYERNASTQCERNAPTPTPSPTQLDNRLTIGIAPNGINGVNGGEKGEGEKEPRHNTKSRSGYIYCKAGTFEFTQYAADYRAKWQDEPQTNKWGGRWFSLLGEK